MSLVYITFHDENIRDIEKQTVVDEHYKFPKYVSIHRKTIRDKPINQIDQQGKKVISASNKYSHKTMGYAETPLDNPSQYLKKNGGVKWKRLNDHICPPSRDLPPIPKTNELQKKGDPKKENFIKKNIKRIKTAAPPKLPEKYVDTVIGEKHNLIGTGLVLEHVFSKRYGKPPAYLKAFQLGTNICNKQMDHKDDTQGVKMLSESERKRILLGLQANHSEVEKTYQLLPIFTDTTSKKQRKAKLEQELKRLEQDIFLLESNPVILICED